MNEELKKELRKIRLEYANQTEMPLQHSEIPTAKGRKVNILWNSFGQLYSSPVKYGKRKKGSQHIERIYELKEKLRKMGIQAKVLPQDFMLKAGIVGGGIGVGWID